MPQISVVIPVFKVEKYLERCLESIKTQTYPNLQIILVDDGSPDLCSVLCDEWIAKDIRISVIHKHNGGLSDARNYGMELATGEHISFIDSDDYISNDYFEEMLNTLVAENSDIVECSVVKFYENDRFEEYQDDIKVSSFSADEGLSGLIAEEPFHQHVWNKLYRRDLIKDIIFPVGKLNEDEFWTYQVFGNAKKVTKINRTMYYYFQRSTSIMGESFSLNRLDALEGKKNRQDYIEENYPTLTSQSKINFFSSCVFLGQSVLKRLKKHEKSEAKKKIDRYLNVCKLSKTELNSIQGKNRFWYTFADKSFWLCCKIRAIMKIGF